MDLFTSTSMAHVQSNPPRTQCFSIVISFSRKPQSPTSWAFSPWRLASRSWPKASCCTLAVTWGTCGTSWTLSSLLLGKQQPQLSWLKQFLHTFYCFLFSSLQNEMGREKREKEKETLFGAVKKTSGNIKLFPLPIEVLLLSDPSIAEQKSQFCQPNFFPSKITF